MTNLFYVRKGDKKHINVSNVFPLPVSLGAESQFGETLIANRTPIIELNSAYGTSALRDVETVNNSAEITNATTGEILLSTGATASSTAQLDSAERIRYIPGYGCEVGLGIRVPTAPDGNKSARWGIRQPNGNEAIEWGVDADGLFIAVTRDGTETLVRQSAFNLDTIDGSGATGFALDLTEGNIFQIDFTWYGYGQIRFDILGTVNGEQKIIPAHQLKVDGATSIQTPNLPVSVIVTNGADAEDFDVYVGGRQASIVGKYIPKFRTVAEVNAAVSTSTTAVPLVSFRNKTGFEDRSVEIDLISGTASSEDHIFEVYLEPTLGGTPSWSTPTNATAAETALEVDVAATSLSGGVLIFASFFPAGQANKANASDIGLSFDVPENQVLTLAARTVTGTGTATGFMRMKEEW